MLGKIFKKKEDEFFMAIPEGAGAVETPAEFAPTIAEKTAAVEGAEAIATTTTPAPASYVDPSTIIAAALQAYSASTTGEAAAVGTFADNYLVQAGNKATRRRPGVNMTEFMGMARNVRR
jgi:hypothetical protein